jgi:hypothetical protein
LGKRNFNYFRNFVKFFNDFLKENSSQENQNYMTPMKFNSDKEREYWMSTRYKTVSTSSQDELQDPLVFDMDDVEKNKSEGNKNLYDSNYFYNKSDINDANMISEIINSIRFHFQLVEDDSFIFNNILLPLNFDLDDIFAYLGDPANSSKIFY